MAELGLYPGNDDASLSRCSGSYSGSGSPSTSTSTSMREHSNMHQLSVENTCREEDGSDLDHGQGESRVLRHEIKTVSEEERLRLNGETKAQMEHYINDWKSRKYDTCADLPWEIDKSLSGRDTFVWIMTGLYLLPKNLVFFPVVYILVLIMGLPCYLYSVCQRTPTDAILRTTR